MMLLRFWKTFKIDCVEQCYYFEHKLITVRPVESRWVDHNLSLVGGSPMEDPLSQFGNRGSHNRFQWNCWNLNFIPISLHFPPNLFLSTFSISSIMIDLCFKKTLACMNKRPYSRLEWQDPKPEKVLKEKMELVADKICMSRIWWCRWRISGYRGLGEAKFR